MKVFVIPQGWQVALARWGQVSLAVASLVLPCPLPTVLMNHRVWPPTLAPQCGETATFSHRSRPKSPNAWVGC